MAMLDEIVCLGSNWPNDRNNQHRVSGVVLHVEKSGENAPYSLTFKRENSSVVQIGRRSGHEPDKAHTGPLTSAMFRCAVVSRKHAKIIFSDGGYVYIIDSGSHHGTHLRKLGDSCPRILKPETSTLLNDGDTVTFGKPVGKGDEWVKPVIARVQLLYTPTPFHAFTVHSPCSSEKSKSSSGRYGIHDSSSPDDLYSDSSDIEEIPPPETSPIPPIAGQNEQLDTNLVTSDLEPLGQSEGPDQVTAAYSAFKRLISPAMRRLPSVSEIIGDKGACLFDVASISLPSLPIIPAPMWGQDDAIVPSFGARRRDINELRLDSGASSPMDLGSPSAAEVDSRQPSTPLLTPVFDSLGASLLPLIDLPSIFSSVVGTPSSPGSEPTSLSPGIALHDSRPANDVKLPSAPAPAPAPAPTSHAATTGSTENVSTSSEIAEIQRTLKQLEASVTKLHLSRRKYKSRFNANVSFMSNKLSEIDDKFAEVDAEYNVLCDQVEEVQHGDLPDFARQIEDLNDRVDEIITDRDNDMFRTPEARSSSPMPMEEMKTTVKFLNGVIEELRTFHLKSQEELSHHLSDMTAAREEAMMTLEQAKALLASAPARPTTVASLDQETQVCSSPMIGSTTEIIQVVDERPPHQTPVPTCLKRKRDDTEEDERDSPEQAESVDEVMDDPAKMELVAEMNQGDSTDGVAKGIDLSANVEPPPRKKIRTIGSVFAQTATAVTIGAVVTWSALAFS